MFRFVDVIVVVVVSVDLILIALLFIKQHLDGDLGYYGDSLTCFMKQKHRMIWERRHGKIGCNKKETEDDGWYA